MVKQNPRILIIGGGFGGIATALKLVDLGIKADIRLVSDKHYFEYKAGLYRLMANKSPVGACIQLQTVFEDTPVDVIVDRIVSINHAKKVAIGQSGSRYQWDYVVIALGSQTAYYNIPGLEKYSYNFNTVNNALRLKNHITGLFEKAKTCQLGQKCEYLSLIIVGGGPSGVEAAGELASYCRQLAAEHGVPPSLVTIDLMEGGDRLLASLSPHVSSIAWHRLHHLGVNIFLSQKIEKEDMQKLVAGGMSIKSKTVIWTAGVKPNDLLTQTKNLKFDKRGRVIVDQYLQAKGLKNVFVIGDNAATQYSGMAQTAKHDGEFVATHLRRKITNQKLKPYLPMQPFYAIPLGRGQAVVVMWWLVITGRLGWWLRRLADLRYFLTILPIHRAIGAWLSSQMICEVDINQIEK